MRNEISTCSRISRASPRPTVQSQYCAAWKLLLGIGCFPIAAILRLSVGRGRVHPLHRRYMLTPCPFWSNDYRGLLVIVFRNRGFLFGRERRSSVWKIRSGRHARATNAVNKDCRWQGLIVQRDFRLLAYFCHMLASLLDDDGYWWVNNLRKFSNRRWCYNKKN